jgi:hypothetical protein
MENLFVESPLRIANWVYSADQRCLMHFESIESVLSSDVLKHELSTFLQQTMPLLPRAILPSRSVRIVHCNQTEHRTDLHIHDAFVVGTGPLIFAGQTSQLPIVARSSSQVRLGRKGWLTTFPLAPDENPVHALKAPVNRIVGIASILQRTGSDDPEKRELYTFLEQSSERLKRLVHWLLNEEGATDTPRSQDASRYISRFLKHSHIEAEFTETSGPYGTALFALLAGAERQGFSITLSGGCSSDGHAYLDFIVCDEQLDGAIADRISFNGWVFPSEVIDYLRTYPNVPLIVIKNGIETVYRLSYAHPTVQVETQNTAQLVQ